MASEIRLTGLLLRQISGGALLGIAAAIAVVTALALTVALLGSDARAEAERMDTIGDRLLEVLRDGGLSGLTQKLVDFESAKPFSAEPVEVAVWRIGTEARPYRATSGTFSAATSDLAAGSSGLVSVGGQSFFAVAPDIAAISTTWNLPMADVKLAYGLPSPGERTKTTWLTIGTVWTGLALALGLGLLLHTNHRRRYRDGLAAINIILERFSAGDTKIRPSETTPIPELRNLAHHLNNVLPKLDELISGLRYMSAHLAHELNTPLQSIRSSLPRIIAGETVQARTEQAAKVERIIDVSNSRLRSLMQLFRLEALEPVAMSDGLDLSELVELALDDIVDALERFDRVVERNIEPGMLVTGNANLLELLVSNLLGNANKYARAGALTRISLTQGDGQFRLSVANTGSTFPSDVVERAFEIFSRGSSTSDVPGVGIGLSLVRAIAQRHGFRAEIGPPRDAAEVVITGPVATASSTRGSQA